MSYPTIQAEARHESGKGAARRARLSGKIPAVAYGGGGSAIPLMVSPRDLQQLRRSSLGWNSPFLLAVEGRDDVGLAMLQDVQKHPVSGELLHADFKRVQDDTAVVVRVPVRITGKAPGVELGGRLAQTLRDVSLSCVPSRIPEAVVVDVSTMNVGDKVLLSSLPMAEGVSLVFRHDATVVNIARGRVAKAAGKAAEEKPKA
jgi:large subunit ribosomal protein L25